MDSLKKVLNNIIYNSPIHILNYANFNIKIGGNNNKLISEFISLLHPHFTIGANPCDLLMSFYLVVDSSIRNSIMFKDDPSSKKTMTYCSTEKGTVRMNFLDSERYRCFQTTKTNTVLIQDKHESLYFFIVGDDYLQNPTWYKDGFNFFEHIVNRYLNMKGSILLHASMLKRGENVVLICGKKRSGKTTLLFEMCHSHGFTPISVDKVHIFESTNGFQAFGFPSRLRVLAGTLSKYTPIFNSHIPKEFLDSDPTILWKGLSQSKVTIPYETFEKFINKKFESTGVVTSILFPNVSIDAQEENSSKMTTLQFLTKVRPCSYTPENPEEDWWSEIGKDEEVILHERAESILIKMSKNLIGYEIHGSNNLSKVVKSFLDIC